MKPKYVRPFARAIQNWITAGCPRNNNYNFADCCGLCYNYAKFLKKAKPELPREVAQELREALSGSFTPVYPDSSYFFPFDPSPTYYSETDNKYTNIYRLDWIKKHAR